jgi:hypothetical protein
LFAPESLVLAHFLIIATLLFYNMSEACKDREVEMYDVERSKANFLLANIGQLQEFQFVAVRQSV